MSCFISRGSYGLCVAALAIAVAFMCAACGQSVRSFGDTGGLDACEICSDTAVARPDLFVDTTDANAEPDDARLPDIGGSDSFPGDDGGPSDLPDQETLTVHACPTPADACRISSWDDMESVCVESTAPDGTPCADGYCMIGVCHEDCWTAECPAGLALSDGCRCGVVSTGSDRCLDDAGFVPCEEVEPWEPWYFQDALQAGGTREFEYRGDGTVFDPHTGLFWAAEPSPPIRYDKASEYCGNLSDPGGPQWRVPVIRELFTLVDAGKASCMWNPVFGACQKMTMFWSSTAAYMTAQVCTVHPRGNIEACEKVDMNPVRCVSGPVPPDDPVPDRWLNLGEIVYDRSTGLGWDAAISGEGLAWRDALSLCAEKGSGWRLPTTAELVSIVDMTKMNEGCAKWDDALGPFCSNQLYFWTSTPNPVLTAPPSVFAVHFFSGHVHENPMSQMFNCRCVKDFSGHEPANSSPELYH